MDVPNGEPVRAEVIRPPVSNLYDVPRQRKRFRAMAPQAAFQASPACSRGRARWGPLNLGGSCAPVRGNLRLPL